MKERKIPRYFAIALLAAFIALTATSCDLFSPPGGTLVVTNGTGQAIYYLYVTEQSNEYWGSDRLGAMTILYSGNSITLDDLDPDTYDILAEDAASTTIAEDYGIVISSGETTYYTIF